MQAQASKAPTRSDVQATEPGMKEQRAIEQRDGGTDGRQGGRQKLNPSPPLAQPEQKVTQGATTRTHTRQEAMEDRGTCLGFRGDDISTVKKKKHKKNKKHKKHKAQKRISKTWFGFVDRAYVGTKDRDVLHDRFGTAGEA